MPDTPAQYGAQGYKFTLTLKDTDGTVQDISAATGYTIVFSKPSGSNVTKTASFTTDGTDGKIEWTTTATTDLDEVGRWRLQAHITGTSLDVYSGPGHFRVFPNL